MVVRQSFGLGNVGDDVLTKAVNAHVQPVTQNFLDLLAHKRIVHVQIGLFDGEYMQIVFLAQFIPLPCLTLEIAVPVVGQLAVFLGRPPDVVIRVRLDAPARFLEPLVFVACVVDDEIHDELHAACMQTVQHLAEGFHAAVHGINVHIVRDVVAAVRAGRGIQRREPYAVHTEALQIVQLFIHAPEVAHAVAVTVLEAPRPDLIKDHVFIPTFACHSGHILSE